jgi:uncharacterized protein
MIRELTPAVKLTVCVGGDERHAHHPLYREVLRVLHEERVSGASLTRGVMSYGVRRVIHSSLDEITMENLPVIIEAVDERKKIENAAARIAEMLGEHGLIELQPSMIALPNRVEGERSQS